MTILDQEQLSIGESVGQVVMPRIDFNESGHIEDSIRLVEEYNVAGFIVFNGELEQVRDLINHLQFISKYPLFFGCDAERGLGQIVKGCTQFPFLMAQGAADDIDLIKKQAEVTATEMKYCRINLLFAPVLDINTNPNNPIVNIRSFSDNPKTVARLANAFISKINEYGVFACGKHFPGHGSTDVDSHVNIPELNKSLNELDKLEFVPFKKAIESGVDVIMVGHIAVPEIDGELKPAIVSKVLVQDVLRKDLRFEKVVITDSFRMDSLKGFGAEFEVAIKSLEAGCNIILDPRNSYELIDKMKLEINNNKTLVSKIKKSSRIVLELKKRLSNNGFAKSSEKEHKDKLVQKISAESVCVIKGGKINSEKVDINVLDVTDKDRQLRPFTDCLEDNGVVVNSINYISENNLPIYSSSFNVINLIVTSVVAWSGHFQINSEFKFFLDKMSNAGSKNILVSFGSPYVIKNLDQFNVIICSFDSLPECQIAVAKNLLGKCSSTAKLPIGI